jgi:hypothetical protein
MIDFVLQNDELRMDLLDRLLLRNFWYDDLKEKEELLLD